MMRWQVQRRRRFFITPPGVAATMDSHADTLSLMKRARDTPDTPHIALRFADSYRRDLSRFYGDATAIRARFSFAIRKRTSCSCR